MKEIYDELTRLRDEQYAKSMEGVKKIVMEHGEKTNPFVDRIIIDVRDYDIEYTAYSTLDEIYYIPATDELGYIIYKGEKPSDVYLTNKFKRSDINTVYSVFLDLYYTYCQ